MEILFQEGSFDLSVRCHKEQPFLYRQLSAEGVAQPLAVPSATHGVRPPVDRRFSVFLHGLGLQCRGRL